MAFSTASAPVLMMKVFFGKLAGRQRIQLFRNGDVAFVRRYAEAEMQILFQLFANRGDDTRRAVTHVETADTPGKINKAIAVHVLDDRAFRLRSKERRRVIRPARDSGFAARHQCARLGSRYFRVNLNRFHLRVPFAGGHETAAVISSTTRLGFVEIDEDLLGFQIFFEAPGTKLAPEAGLLVAAQGAST